MFEIFKIEATMKKISCVSFVFVLILIQNALCSDFFTTSDVIGFENVYHLDKYVKMVNAGNEAGKIDVLRFGIVIKKGSRVTKETVKYENGEMIAGRFIVDGYKNYLYAVFIKKETIPNTGKPDNSATDAFLKK